MKIIKITESDLILLLKHAAQKGVPDNITAAEALATLSYIKE